MSVDIEPGSPEWMGIITPSKVAAILGVSRWESPYRLWRRMKGLSDPEPPKDIFDLGHDFEPAMASIWKRENPGWQLSPGEVQIVPSLKFRYPAAATIDRRGRRGRSRRVVEFKTARHLEDWGDWFTDQAPSDYVAQVIAQMMFTGYTEHPAHLMVLGPYFEAHTYVIPFDDDVAAEIDDRCAAFWESLDGDVPPDLDDSKATYDCVREQHPDIDGTTVEVPYEQAWRVLQFDADLKANTACLRGAKTRLLDLMGNAKLAECQGIKVADRRPHGSGSVALNLATKNLDELNELESEERLEAREAARLASAEIAENLLSELTNPTTEEEVPV